MTRRIERTGIERRDFLKTAGAVALGAGAMSILPVGRVWAVAANSESARPAPESLVKTLYDSLSPKQREAICFAWDYQDPERGLLRTRVSANWDITDHFINGNFYTADQKQILRGIFEGIYEPEWHDRIDQQLGDDAGGFGEQNSIAIFGEPGSDQFEFVMTGRHMTVRADGNTTKHVAFGGPIFYGHAADGFNEGPDHEGNVFWPQALAANQLYDALDGKQQKLALVTNRPRESNVGFRGQGGDFHGIPVSELARDQKQLVEDTLRMLVEPYRKTDRDEVIQCLGAQGGLDACYMAFYSEGDIGNDKVWDCWRLEGPSFVWNFRGEPHVHVWVNVADDPSVKLNA
jgi:hypothetical protein